MSNCKVVGVSVSSGEYQGYNYKNLVLHCLVIGDQYTEGDRCQQYKIKWKNLNTVFNLNKTATEIDNLNPSHFKDLLGKYITCLFNQYREVISVVVEKPEKANS